MASRVVRARVDDQRIALDQTVAQRRFADIRAPDETNQSASRAVFAAADSTGAGPSFSRIASRSATLRRAGRKEERLP